MLTWRLERKTQRARSYWFSNILGATFSFSPSKVKIEWKITDVLNWRKGRNYLIPTPINVFIFEEFNNQTWKN